MAIQVYCQGCQRNLTLKSELAGKKVKCKQCGSVLAVPAMAAAVKPAAAAHRPTAPARPPANATRPAAPRPAAAKPPAARPAPVRKTPPPPPPPPPEDDGLIAIADLESLPTAPAARPARYVAPAAAPARPTAVKPAKSRSYAGDSGTLKKIGSAVVAALFLLGIAGKIYRGYVRVTGDDPISANTSSWSPTNTTATVPPRPALENHQSYQLATITLTNRVGLSESVKVYLPPGQHAPKSLACVMIAPAGSIGIVGNRLTEEDSREHLPYVQAGFAVVAYSLSGPIGQDLEKVSDREFKIAAEQFHSTRGGVCDAQDAMAFALERFPEIDPNRLAAAGHSSAGTHALLLAQSEPRIKACCAYAPVVNLSDRLGDGLAELRKVLRPIEQWAVEYSPGHTGSPRCPTLLFHARDDSTVPYDDSAGYAQRFPAQVKLVSASSGGHFDSMVNEGIPAGISFLKEKLK